MRRSRTNVREASNNLDRVGASLLARQEILMKDKIEKVLAKIRPNLEADGGNVEFVEVTKDNVVKLRLKGACASCPMSSMTLQMGIERILKQEIPEIKSVEQVD
jgi:Fe-S cluster biogenesis protein NfuA